MATLADSLMDALTLSARRMPRARTPARILAGHEALSLASLRGRARSYGGSYARTRDAWLQRAQLPLRDGGRSDAVILRVTLRCPACAERPPMSHVVAASGGKRAVWCPRSLTCHAYADVPAAN